MRDSSSASSAAVAAPGRGRLATALTVLLGCGQLLAALVSMVPPLFALGTPCGAAPGYDTPQWPAVPLLLLVLGALLASAGALLIVLARAQRRRRAWARRGTIAWAMATLLWLAGWAVATGALWSDLMTFPYYPTLPLLIALLFAPYAIGVLWRARRAP